MSALEQYVGRHITKSAGARRDPDDARIGGVLLFCAIGLALSILAAIFGWLQLPEPMFF